LHCFHTIKDVFLLVRAGKKAKAKANALRTDLVMKRKVTDETTAGTWTQCKKRRKITRWRYSISHEIYVFEVLDADLTILKMHMMSHRVKQICRYGALQQYSAGRHGQAHKTDLKHGWKASNHNLNYLTQAVIFQRHILCFEIRELNLQAFAQLWVNRAAA